MKGVAGSLHFRPLGADTGTSGNPPAPEYFQTKLDQNLEGGRGVYMIPDDILISGRGSTMREAAKDHDATLLRLLDHCREINLKLPRGKLQLNCSETPFII